MRIGGNVRNEQREPEVGDLAPEFTVEVGHDRLAMSNIAARCKKLILLSQDSYRYHPN